MLLDALQTLTRVLGGRGCSQPLFNVLGHRINAQLKPFVEALCSAIPVRVCVIYIAK